MRKSNFDTVDLHPLDGETRFLLRKKNFLKRENYSRHLFFLFF